MDINLEDPVVEINARFPPYPTTIELRAIMTESIRRCWMILKPQVVWA